MCLKVDSIWSKWSLHAAELEGQPVEAVVDLQHMAVLEGGLGGAAAASYSRMLAR